MEAEHDIEGRAEKGAAAESSTDGRRRVERRGVVHEPRTREKRLRARRTHDDPSTDVETASDDAVVVPVKDDRIRRGNKAEQLAADMLLRLGYRVIDRNYRCHVGELDIVAYDDAVLVFVEVRSRADDSHGHAAEMVTRPKQRKVARVAACYIEHVRPIGSTMRFDVVAITGDDIQLIKDAWRLGRYS